ALVALLVPALLAAVEPGEDDVDRALPRARLGEQRRERRPAPATGADRLLEPRLADDVRVDPRAPVAGALHGRDELDLLAGLQLGERERQRTLHVAADLEPPRRSVDRRDVVVDQQVVEPDRRDVVPQRLERQSVVPGGELELLERDGHT